MKEGNELVLTNKKNTKNKADDLKYLMKILNKMQGIVNK